MQTFPPPPVITKVVASGDYHGGAWKVAYADFATAMMAFFLLMWLLNVTTQEEKELISNYFDPTSAKVSESTNGAGGVMGGLSMSPQGAMATDVQNIQRPDKASPRPQPKAETKQDKTSKKEKAIEKAKDLLKKTEEEKFNNTADKIKQAIKDDPELAELSKNILIDMTPEGLRIQIVDEKGKPMFASGSARMFDKTRMLIQKMTGIIQGNTVNELSVRGHTDSVPYGTGADYTNWELSGDRANASRRVMIDNGFPAARINNVMGKADTEPLMPEDTTNPRNRRITVILLREELTNPDFGKKVEAEASAIEASGELDIDDAPAQIPVGTFQRTPGQVQFP